MPVVLVVIAAGAFLLWQRRGRTPRRQPDLGPTPWTAGTDWTALRPLTSAESRRLLRHPSFLLGVLMTPLMLAAATSEHAGWTQLAPSIALGLVPLGWATIIAADLLSLRPRRTGAGEMLAAAPAPQPVRTAALLLTAIPAAAVAAALAGAWVVWLHFSRHPAGSMQLADVAAGVLLVAGSVTVGVAVGRVLPNPFFGFAAVAAVVLLQARFLDVRTWPWNRPEADPGRFLAFLANGSSVRDAALEVRPAGWHLAYLAALITVMACVAFVRDHPPGWFGGVAAVAVCGVVITGWAQLRPPSDAAIATMVGYLTEPGSRQRCTTDGATTFCAYPDRNGEMPEWAARVSAVRALLPAGVATRQLRVTDRVPTVVGNADCAPKPLSDALHPAVAKALSPAQIWPADADVHPGTNAFPCGGRTVGQLFLAIQVGSWAVGLPPSPHDADIRCAAPGQARAVIALWLAAAATPEGAEFLQKIADEHGWGPATFDDWDNPPMLGVRFSTTDIRMAVELARLPVATVRAAVTSGWDLLVEPSTPSTAIIGSLRGEPPNGSLDLSAGGVCR